MKIGRFTPSPALQPFIKEFIIIESSSEVYSKTLPDTSLIMALRYAGSIMKVGAQQEEALPTSVISGLRRNARSFHYVENTANFLVVFKEGGISSFLKVPAHELFDMSISADNLFSTGILNEILERLSAARHHRERVSIVELYLTKILLHHKPDLLIRHAVALIHQHNGIIRIKELANTLYISVDAFEKRFRAQIGSSPKQYASIVRLRKLIEQFPSYTTLTAASYEAGYFDQAHFIRDFKLFTGQTPKDFFKGPQFW